MSSLTDLNSYSNNTIEFTDNRPAGVLLTWPNAKDLQFTLESGTFTVQRSIDIEEIIKPELALVEYEIDVSSVIGTVVNWNTVPIGCNVVSSEGVYIIQGIDSVSDWEIVRAPLITVPNTFQGSFFYTVTIRWVTNLGIQEENWQVGNYIPVSQLSMLSTLNCIPTRNRGSNVNLLGYFNIGGELQYAGLSSPDTFNFLKSTTQLITGTPSIIYEPASGTEFWTITITPSVTSVVDTMSTTGTGGTSSFNNTTKVLTLTGTESQIDYRLANITLTTTNVESDLTLTYQAINDVPSPTYNVQQFLNCLNLEYLTDARGNATYTRNIASNIGLAGPQIYDIDYIDNGTYTLTVAPLVSGQVQNITSRGVTPYWGVEQEYVVSSIAGPANIQYGVSNNLMVTGVWADSSVATVGGSLIWYTKPDLTYSAVKSVYESTSYGAFGRGLAIADDDTVIAGSPGYNSSTYEDFVIVYLKSGETWVQSQIITSPITGNNTEFGRHIACSANGDVLAISAEGDAGRVYIYTRTGTGNYNLQSTITDPENENNGYFGSGGLHMSLDGIKLAVMDFVGGNPPSGSPDTRVFVKVGAWDQQFFSNNVTQNIIGFTADNNSYLWHNTNNIYVVDQNGSNWSTVKTQAIPGGIVSAKFTGDRSAVIVESSDYDYEFIKYEFNQGTNTFTQVLSFNVNDYMQQSYSWNVNYDGSEISFHGTLQNGQKGFMTYTNGIKPGTFDAITKSYTIQGTKTDINNDIDTLTLTSSSISNIQLTYNLTTPEANIQSKVVTITNSG